MTIKELREKKASLVEELEAINSACEERAQNGGEVEMTEDEARSYNEKSKELDGINALIERKIKLREAGINEPDGEDDGEGEGEKDEDDEAQEEERAFCDFIASVVNGRELRSESKLTTGANGAIIPKTIAGRVIQKLENICDIYARTTKFNFKGEVAFPVIDDSSDDVIVAYADEFSTLTSHVHTFSSVNLKGYLFASLCLISKSLINNSDINVVDIVVTRMALAMKKFLEKQCLEGTEGKMTGVLSSTNILTGASASAVTTDEIISLTHKVIDAYQQNCVFIMHPDTREALLKLKDNDGKYLLNRDLTTGFTDRILGKPVLVSDQMPRLGSGNKAIFYGDPSGLYVNIVENMSIEVLREKYAEMHAIGLNLWAEMDSKIVEPQKLAVFKCAG